MITILTGDNDFEIQRAVDSMIATFDGQVEHKDGETLEMRSLPDLLMGVTLFTPTRLVVVKNVSLNKTVWPVFGDWIPRIAEEIHVVLVEPKLDKRTKTYKLLQKAADLREFSLWTDRDTRIAGEWVIEEAKRLGFMLDTKSAQALLARVGLDQWLLLQALEKLAFADEVNEETVMELVDANPAENVFNLFDSALKGDVENTQEMIQTLKLGEDPYRVMGLLASQAFQFAALAVTNEPTNVVAKDIGAHPFALGKLTGHAKKRGHEGAKKVVAIIADADMAMKSSAADPWLLIEQALIKIAII
ncbi:MAG TPA: DNA polymerase III subunit delta [Candidatus Saccharimonadales bacterium]|nr:DNA polymerase III subunit delta [Candidatus Saccharimonadales bacterium]